MMIMAASCLISAIGLKKLWAGKQKFLASGMFDTRRRVWMFWSVQLCTIVGLIWFLPRLNHPR